MEPLHASEAVQASPGSIRRSVEAATGEHTVDDALAGTVVAIAHAGAVVSAGSPVEGGAEALDVPAGTSLSTEIVASFDIDLLDVTLLVPHKRAGTGANSTARLTAIISGVGASAKMAPDALHLNGRLQALHLIDQTALEEHGAEFGALVSTRTSSDAATRVITAEGDGEALPVTNFVTFSFRQSIAVDLPLLAPDGSKNYVTVADVAL